MSAALRWLRFSGIDLGITIAVIAWAVAEALTLESWLGTPGRVAYAVAVTVPMLLRNRMPVAILAVAYVAFLADLIFETLPLEAVTPLQLVPLATYAVASVGSDRRTAGWLALGSTVAPVLLVIALPDDAPVTVGEVITLLVLQSVVAFAGWAVRLRREEAAHQAARAQAARLGADDLVREGLEEARGRIARELRAIVARGLGVMEQQMAGAATATVPELGRIAADVQRGAAGVMHELQRLLGVLHDQAPGVEVPVSPEAAVAAARERGWQVELDDPAGATPGATLAAGRVLEELLAGPPGAVRGRVVERSGGLRLQVSGSALARPLGDPVLRGSLAERVRLHGGAMRVRRRPGRRRTVIVDLPAGGGSASRAAGAPGLFAEVLVVGVAALGLARDVRVVDHPWATLVLGTLLFLLPLALRRRAPLAGVLVIAAGMLVFELAGLFADPTLMPLILGMLGAAAAAMHVPSRAGALAGTIAVATSAVVVNLLELPKGVPLTDTAIILFLVGMSYGFGRLVREQMEHTSAARDDEALAAVEQTARLRLAVDDERRAVARDLHDIVAHGVSMIGVLAGAAQAQLASDPERARASILAASSTIGQVRVELERLTVVLGGAAGPDATEVGLRDLEQLAADARRAGQEVTLEFGSGGGFDGREGAGSGGGIVSREGATSAGRLADGAVQPGVAVSAYRIVQEALTNARKHAPGAPVAVGVDHTGGRLELHIRNQAPARPAAGESAGTGRGIAGMRERARLLGGELKAGPAPGGGFAVTAWLPVEPA